MVIGTPTVLNLIPGGVMKVIHVNQVNENIEIQFRIMNGAQPFNVPEGVSCTIRGTKGDSFGYAADVAVTAGSNIVTVTLTEQLTAVAGAGNIFELVFVGASDDMKVSTENFLLDVERAALGEDTVISDSDLAYAGQVLDQLQSVGAVNAQVQQNKANIAAEITRATAAEQTLQQNINAEAATRQAADNTLQSNINAEASTRATTDASLQSQIDQLVAPSGEAPSAAEVENARIGSDGTVYPTLGDAIRTQNSLLKSHLDNSITYIHDLSLESSEWIQGVRSRYLIVSANANRCTTKDVFHMFAGDTIVIDNIASGTKAAIATSSGYDSGWKTGMFIYQATVETYAFVVAATTAGNTPITPSDVTISVTIIDHTSATIENARNITATANALDNVERRLNGEDLCLYPTYVQGSGSGSGGPYTITTNLYRIATADLIDMSGIESININVASGYRVYIIWFDDSRQLVAGRGWFTENTVRTVESKYLAYTIASVDDAESITPDNFNNSMASITYSLPTTGIPAYWNTALNTAITSIQTQEETSDAQGDSFVFITDTHWNVNAQHSPDLIRAILDATNVRKVIFGGDVLTLYSTKAEALSVGRDFYKAFGDIDVFSILGNHDVNNNQSTYGQDAYLTYPQVYSYMFKKSEPHYNGMPKWSDTNGDVNRNFYYYLDNETQKIRYIYLNNGRSRIGTVQTNWMKSRITELESGWTVVVFAHRYWIGTSDGMPVLDGALGTDIVTALNEIYDTANATIAALIVGHCHYDYSIVTAKGYPVIATMTDCYTLSDTVLGETMTLGTDTEQAFDVYSINTSARTINTTRVGAGSDRSFTY